MKITELFVVLLLGFKLSWIPIPYVRRLTELITYRILVIWRSSFILVNARLALC